MVEYLCLGYGASVESMQTNELNLNLIYRPPLQSFWSPSEIQIFCVYLWKVYGQLHVDTIVEVLLKALPDSVKFIPCSNCLSDAQYFQVQGPRPNWTCLRPMHCRGVVCLQLGTQRQ
jgi:hypothetical protein